MSDKFQSGKKNSKQKKWEGGYTVNRSVRSESKVKIMPKWKDKVYPSSSSTTMSFFWTTQYT